MKKDYTGFNLGILFQQILSQWAILVTGYNPEYIQKHTNCSWVRERPWADLSNIHPGVNPVDSTWIKIPQGETR